MTVECAVLTVHVGSTLQVSLVLYCVVWTTASVWAWCLLLWRCVL